MDLIRIFQGAEYFWFGGSDVLATVGMLHMINFLMFGYYIKWSQTAYVVIFTMDRKIAIHKATISCVKWL